LKPNAHPDALRGHWGFDEAHFWDLSGNSNHANCTESIGVAFAPGGRTTAAKIEGSKYITIPEDESLDLASFSVTMWAYFHVDEAYNNAESN
jgi:hypothetical protein